MSKKQETPEELAALLSTVLGKELLTRLKTGEAKSGDLQVALNFVKFNQVKDSEQGLKVAEALQSFNFPFSDSTDNPH